MGKGERKKSDLKDEESNDNNKISPQREKKKRNRRPNNEIKERNYSCPHCEKKYSSNSALNTHKKNKHNYGINDEQDSTLKHKGRPKNNINLMNETFRAQNNYKSFFDNINRKKPNDISEKENEISFNDINQYIKEFYDLCYCYSQNIKYRNIVDYPLYKLIKDNWDKEIQNKRENKSFSEGSNDKAIIESESPCIDELFYLYLKEYSNEASKTYFSFMIKFVFLFREFINDFKKDKVPYNIIDENKKEYTQLFNGIQIPELCNDFFSIFMDSHRYFGLNQEELIEITQHFCFWLYDNGYSPSHLGLSD